MAAFVKQDEMSAKERLVAALQGKPFDRVPCFQFIGDHASKLISAKVSEIHTNTDKLVAAEIAAHKAYDTEGVAVSPGLCGFAEALGSKVAFPDYGTPYIAEFAIKEIADIDRIEVPDPARAARFPLILKAAELLVAELADKISVSVFVIGPFSTAANTRGTEKLMRDLHRNPEFVHKLLRLATDVTVGFVKEAAKLGVSFAIGDPTASGTLISQKQFREFAFPYLKEVTDAIIRFGKAAPLLHICGNSSKIWHDMADSGASVLSLDDCIDLAEAKKAVGHRVALMGNVRPTRSMFLGTPADVENNAKECLRKAYDNPRGYILALGCGLPFNTPQENIRALLGAARKFGRYPLDPANFN
jgi:uroporphyrinogen decarboxylase